MLVANIQQTRSILQVPRSSRVVAEDTDNALFTVTLFRRVADTFKTAARTRGFQVTSAPATLPYVVILHILQAKVGAMIVTSDSNLM